MWLLRQFEPMAIRKKYSSSNQVLSPDELRIRMENFCAYRERCPQEIRFKLRELGATGQEAQQVFQELRADNFFDEQRFASAYAGGKFRNNHWGKVRIRLELQQREIALLYINQALDEIDTESYHTTLVKLLEKKLAQYQGTERLGEKAAASLIRSGYEPDLVFKYLKKIK